MAVRRQVGCWITASPPQAPNGGTLEIRLDKPDAPVIARVQIPKNGGWANVQAKLSSPPAGIRDLIVSTPEKSEVAVDWVSFE